jgi:Na+-translocating ferredoxin:NAD+ oxidoreductase RNF subunit RnfB
VAINKVQDSTGEGIKTGEIKIEAIMGEIIKAEEAEIIIKEEEEDTTIKEEHRKGIIRGTKTITTNITVTMKKEEEMVIEEIIEGIITAQTETPTSCLLTNPDNISRRFHPRLHPHPHLRIILVILRMSVLFKCLISWWSWLFVFLV